MDALSLLGAKAPVALIVALATPTTTARVVDSVGLAAAASKVKSSGVALPEGPEVVICRVLTILFVFLLSDTPRLS